MLARLMYVDHAERGEEAELTAATIEVRAGVHMGAIMFEGWTAFSFPVVEMRSTRSKCYPLYIPFSFENYYSLMNTHLSLSSTVITGAHSKICADCALFLDCISAYLLDLQSFGDCFFLHLGNRRGLCINYEGWFNENFRTRNF